MQGLRRLNEQNYEGVIFMELPITELSECTKEQKKDMKECEEVDSFECIICDFNYVCERCKQISST